MAVATLSLSSRASMSSRKSSFFVFGLIIGRQEVPAPHQVQHVHPRRGEHVLTQHNLVRPRFDTVHGGGLMKCAGLKTFRNKECPQWPH
jgi:hypothetical protein